MKKYVIILAAAVLGLVFSCNDKLDLTTDGRISRGEIFQDRYKIMGGSTVATTIARASA